MATFAVGEIAIVTGQIWPAWECYRGSECEVIRIDNPRDHAGYTIKMADGLLVTCAEDNLRKRRPPQDWLKLCNLDETPLDVRAKTPEVA